MGNPISFSSGGETLFVECEKAISSRRYDILSEKGLALTRLGQSQKNRNEEIAGTALRLHSLICVRDTSDFTIQIENLINEAPKYKDSDIRTYGVLMRTISSYYQRILNDYSQALHYATEYLESTRINGDRNGEASALSAIASIYFQKQDDSGWSYAVESYELAKEIGNLSTRYVASCNMANYLYNKKQIEEAMKYLEEARGFAIRAGLESEESYINSFFGDIYNCMDEPDKAEESYIASLVEKPYTSNFDKVYSHICYAMFLIDRGRLDEALTQLTSAGKKADQYKVSIFQKEIFLLMSRIYEKKRDFARSLEYYKKYSQITLELFSEQKEREFSILHLRNKVSEEERKNMSNHLELVKRGRIIILLSVISLITFFILAGGVFYHHHKMRGYKQTIARYLDNAREEQRLRRQLEAVSASHSERASGGLNIEKSAEIFQNLESMMKSEKIYRDCSLSLDKAAGLLSTNRTYLSQVVNEKSGKSFSTYVNEYRLNEAVELLSDTGNHASLKEIGIQVGFSSPSNFYTLFRQRVGVSPSIFRSNVKNIEDDIQNRQLDNQD